MILTFLNFDTINSSYTSNNPYDTAFYFNVPIRKAKKIYLKSVEIPIGFNNIRTSSNGLNEFEFTVNSVTYTIILTDKVYTSISTLLTDINNAILVLGLSFTVVLSVNSTNSNKITLTLSTSSTITILPTGLSVNILGFTSNQSITGTILNASNNYLLNADNYVNMYFKNIPSNSHNNYGGVMASYKIPLNCTSNVIYYQSENQSFSQYIEITDVNYILTKLHVQILDRWGNIIPSQGLDYSFTLAIEYHS
jgi:hypothetical protein